MSQSASHTRPHPAVQSNNFRWEHGAITPVNSPPNDVLEYDHHTHSSLPQSTSISEVPFARYRPPPAQMIPDNHPLSKSYPNSTINPNVITLRRQSTASTVAPLPANNTSSAPAKSATTDWMQLAPLSPRPPHLSPSASGKLRPLLGIPNNHRDFPLGKVDPMAGTHSTPEGLPVRWPKAWMRNSVDHDLSNGVVLSPTVMIGLPFGGTIEMCTHYPQNDGPPGNEPKPPT